MNMYTVYRYEKNGFGPYNGDFEYQDKLRREHSDNNYRPGFYYEMNKIKHYPDETVSYFSACLSISELRYWFNTWNEALLEDGFKIIEYKLKDILRGFSGMQVFFCQDDIISSKAINPTKKTNRKPIKN